MKELLAQLPSHLAAHLGLSLAALLVGIILSVPLGILVSRVRRFEGPVVGAASVLQTIPSLALLAFMVPALAALGARSIGFLPALIGLSLYSVLPILRNTVTGMSGVDPAVTEAARGVGMTSRESLFRVELPLAMPVIVAGIRTSAVWTVGTATLSTPVGAPSLGNYIFGGLQTRNYASVLVGCVASALLALVIDGLVYIISRGIERRNRRLSGIGLSGFLLLALLATTPLWPSRTSAGGPPITIGAKSFTESYILANILGAQTEKQTGLPIKVLESLGSTVAFDALASGQIDTYVDYSGTLWATVLGKSQEKVDRQTMLVETGRLLDEKYGILLVCPFGFENTYALAMRRQDATRLNARRIGDLAPHAKTLRVGGDYEMFQRAEWKSVTSTYHLEFAKQISMDPSLMYEAAKTGQVDLIGAFSTDGRIAAYDLVVLEDERGALPPYDAVILASARLRKDKPAVIESLRQLCGRIDGQKMQKLNREVDEMKRTPTAVAKDFLQQLH